MYCSCVPDIFFVHCLPTGKISASAVNANRNSLACDGNETCIGYALRELLDVKASKEHKENLA